MFIVLMHIPLLFSSSPILRPPIPTLFPYTTLFRSLAMRVAVDAPRARQAGACVQRLEVQGRVVLETLNTRSEEHTSELQSRRDLVCRLLLEKKKFYI